jgi:hypothetical protein
LNRLTMSIIFFFITLAIFVMFDYYKEGIFTWKSVLESGSLILTVMLISLLYRYLFQRKKS